MRYIEKHVDDCPIFGFVVDIEFTRRRQLSEMNCIVHFGTVLKM